MSKVNNDSEYIVLKGIITGIHKYEHKNEFVISFEITVNSTILTKDLSIQFTYSKTFQTIKELKEYQKNFEVYDIIKLFCSIDNLKQLKVENIAFFLKEVK